jgi:hypothetical protein
MLAEAPPELVEPPPELELPPPDELLPPTLKVVFTTGQIPPLVQALKWMVCVPPPMDTLVRSMSYGVTPMVVVPLLSTEYPNAVGVRPLQPTL